MPDVTHEGSDPMGALTTHRGPLETCPAPECQDRIIEQQEDAEPGTQPTATVAGQSIALNVTGYPDVPNRWGTGSIRVTGLRLDYGNDRTPAGRHAFITGLWINDDGQVTDDPLDRYYDAPDGDTSDWPDWIADLTRQHTPTDRAAVLREAIDVAREEGHRLEDEQGIEVARGARSVAYLLRKLLVKAQPAVPGGQPARATVLHEIADELQAYIDRYRSPSTANWTGAVAFLRRLADEAQQQPAPLTPCTCRQAVHALEHHGRTIPTCPWCTPAPNIRPNQPAGRTVDTVDTRLLGTKEA